MPFIIKAILHGFDLKLVQDNIKEINSKDIICLIPVKNEAVRLPFLIEYYRKLGINHFILIDNNSSDNPYAFTCDQADITVFYTDASYKKSNYAVHWINYLLLRYGCGHWCLVCDSDEFLVYPYMESRNLHELTAYLESRNENSFSTPMIDFYSDLLITDKIYHAGVNPLTICSFFDACAYHKNYSPYYHNIFMQGGVRRRVFFKKSSNEAPAMNKVSLVKWKFYFAFVKSTHMLIPRRLNRVISKTKVSGALLHFKFLNDFKRKVEDEMVNKQHWNNSYEYLQYKSALDSEEFLFNPEISERYKDWTTLLDFGFINLGEWV